MPRSKFYAVKSGRNTGIYDNWGDAKQQVDRYSGQQFKSFNTRAEAQAYMSGSSSSQSGTPYSRLSASHSYSPPRSAPRSTPSSGRHVQEVYTDGSCIGNGRSGARAGWGAYWGDERDSCGPVEQSTNNAGELTAIRETLKEINSKPGNSDYKIYSDSEYSIQAVGKWADKWQTQGWKTSTGEPVKNREIIEDVRSLMKQAKARGINVQLEKVKGHANIPGNEAADRLARRGANC